MRSIKSVLTNPLCIGSMVLRRCSHLITSDVIYLKLLYFFEQGRILHLKSPKSFTEKIQWLKLYNRKPLFCKMVDKLAVKDIVSSIIGSKYIIPTIGKWDSFEEIDFDKLPDSFVLKSTNGSGGAVVICKDKSKLDIDAAKKIICATSSSNVGHTYREWPYTGTTPRIFAETLIADSSSKELKDYKFYCFNGKPLYCQVIANRYTKETIDFYDCNWVHQEFVGLNPSVKQSGEILQKPKNFHEMLDVAAKLSKDIPFLRVDLYNVDGIIYFGETTFFPASGFGTFMPKKWDNILGNLIELSGNNGIQD